jgi:HEAT repeats
MTFRKYVQAFWAMALGSLATAVGAVGQTVERDTTITGPRGRTIQRQVEVQRGPGTIDRQVQIKRPGGTIDRQVQVQRSVVPGWRGGPPLLGGWPRPVWGPRPVIIGPAAPAFGFGVLAVPALNFSFGGGGGGGMGGPGPGGPGGPGMGGPGGGPPPPPDQVALMTQRLQSFYSGNRKEAAYTLGRLGDPRANPSLVHVLKYDSSKDVRIAAAIALGEIGGSDAAIALERAGIYDHREDVRTASSKALERLNAKAKAAAMAPPPALPSGRPPVLPPTTSESPFRNAPAAEAPAGNPESAEPPAEPSSSPPPPPTPVTSGRGAGSQ